LAVIAKPTPKARIEGFSVGFKGRALSALPRSLIHRRRFTARQRQPVLLLLTQLFGLPLLAALFFA
jgi:hypothetical protein